MYTNNYNNNNNYIKKKLSSFCRFFLSLFRSFSHYVFSIYITCNTKKKQVFLLHSVIKGRKSNCDYCTLKNWKWNAVLPRRHPSRLWLFIYPMMKLTPKSQTHPLRILRVLFFWPTIPQCRNKPLLWYRIPLKCPVDLLIPNVRSRRNWWQRPQTVR